MSDDFRQRYHGSLPFSPLDRQSNLVILTGAGISAESGLRTFRDNGGLWENHRIEDVATPQGFGRNPKLVQRFYNLRREQLKEAQPNAAHHALAELEAGWKGRFLLVTQNVDNLHERAGSKRVLHMHGELTKVSCQRSLEVFDWMEDVTPDTQCACCQQRNTLRPYVVWFGEMPLHMETIYAALETCDTFIAIGTSGQVYPAAGFVEQARYHGATTVECNLEPSGNSAFEYGLYGRASETVPQLARSAD